MLRAGYTAEVSRRCEAGDGRSGGGDEQLPKLTARGRRRCSVCLLQLKLVIDEIREGERWMNMYLSK